MLFSALSTLSLASAAAAQMVIKVGATASTSGGIFQFMPPSINATNGTVVTFQFSGMPGNHTVTQSSFSNPCQPLSGGFDSGWVAIPQAGPQAPEFNLTITNDAKPIWFYCKQLQPAPHCKAGMVGAINAAPSGANDFAAFQAAAKASSGNPGQAVGNLVGVGASASAGPGPIPSGVMLFGTPTPGAATATATGTAASASGSGTASGSASASASPTSAASHLAASSVVALLAAALGFAMA